MDAFGPRMQWQELIFFYSMKDTEDLAGHQNARRLKNGGFWTYMHRMMGLSELGGLKVAIVLSLLVVQDVGAHGHRRVTFGEPWLQAVS